MKKTTSLLLCLLMLFCASCGSGQQSAMQTSAEETSCIFVTQTDAELSETVYTRITESISETESSTQKITKATHTAATIAATSAPATTAVKQKSTCSISINCVQAVKNKASIKAGKEYFLPASGHILNETQVEFKEGETVFDVFKRVCQTKTCTDNCEYCNRSGIHYEASYNPGFENYYIEGIHQIYEKDCGPFSGWMYKVNGAFPNYGCSSYRLKNGDRIEFIYTCDLGADIGASVN